MRRGSRIRFDTSELRDLEIDLSKAPARIKSPEAMRKSARQIEHEMRVDATGHKGNWFGRPRTSYVTPTPKVSHDLLAPQVAEIGVEAKGSGGLFHLIAYGGPYNGPAYDPGAGPRRAMSYVERTFADHAEDSVLGKDKS